MFLTGTASQSDYILYIVDAILIIYGLYSMKTANTMKRTGVPAEWICSKEEQKCLKKKSEFCNVMAPKVTQFGVLCIVYGIYAVAERLFIHVKVAQIAGILLFIVGMFLFVRFLQDKRAEYIKKF